MTPRPVARPLAVVAAAALAAASSPGALPAQERGLESVASLLAQVWDAGDAEGIAAFVSRSGARVDLGESRKGSLAPRQAASVLRRLFLHQHRGSASLARSSVVGGEPPRGFAELRWRTTTDGTTEPELRTVFVGFVREEGRWRVAEIRLLR